MIRARNSIRNNYNTNNMANNNANENQNLNLYDYSDTYSITSHSPVIHAPPHKQSSEESAGGGPTASLLPTKRGLSTLLPQPAKAMKVTPTDQLLYRPPLWRQSMPLSYQKEHSNQLLPFHNSNSRQKLSNYLKLQHPGAAESQHNSVDMVTDVWSSNDTETLKQQHGQQEQQPHSHQQQLKLTAKSQSQTFGQGRIRRPRQWKMPLQRLKRVRFGILSRGRAFILEFLQGSSIHGLIYLSKIGLSLVERMIWLAFICVAIFAIVSLSKRTWERFQTSPMVISMDRNKLVWNTSFPSLTVCPHRRIDETKVDEYMDTNPEEFQSDQDRADFRIFVERLAHLTYENVETLPRNKTFGLSSNKYLDLIYQLKWNFEPEMSSGAAVQMFIYETVTEFGVCHSVNSLVARYNSYEYWKNNDWDILDHGDRVTVHPLDGEIYAQIINLSTAYDVYFHGSGDIPIISKQRYTFPETDYTTVELIALEIYTSEEARAFTTKQRKCRYQYEADDMQTVPIYSFGLCLSECRMYFALKVCGCVPHFYRNHLRNGRVLRICDFDGLACLEDIKREIITLKSSRYRIDCHCLSNCDDSNFFVQTYRSRVWFLGANLQWGIIDYPKMQLRRDVLFSFADVLVYIGGLIGFFLGCSALSFTEVLYYFTARFIRRMLCN